MLANESLAQLKTNLSLGYVHIKYANLNQI